ncbi:MAG: Rne/Rng family ribonuclease [Alistipes sp.]|nr:Rne/Rng family ribonuclease [Alistipes sp.]
MNRELIIHVTSTDISIALCEDKVLVELGKDVAQTGFAVGDIYLGKVRKIMPGLNAAFINIGHERDAFIHYQDLGNHFPSLCKIVDSCLPSHRPLKLEAMKLDAGIERDGKIGNYLKVGDLVMTQVTKEAISTKGPRLTCDISLAGRNIVLVPFSSKVFISQKIRSNDDKKRLRRVAAKVLPKNFGVIIRTAAVNATDLDIEQDILAAVEKWNKTCQQIHRRTAPALLLGEMSRANTIIRDTLDGSFSQICVDDEAMYNEILSYVRSVDPSKDKIVKLYRGSVPIFDNFDISRQIKSLFARYVSLRRGAYLVVESTEAMHVIDVNSGNRTKADDNHEQTVLEVNLAAAAEIARQVRLRDLGGIVIIDFIDMQRQQSRQMLYDEMQRLMATDKARHTILPLTKFGLMQITRQRLRPVVIQPIQDVCPTCGGTGKVEPTASLDSRIENQISLLAQDHGERYIRLVVSPYVAAYIQRGIWSLRMKWMLRYRVWIAIRVEHSLGMVDVQYQDREGENMLDPNYIGRRRREEQRRRHEEAKRLSEKVRVESKYKDTKKESKKEVEVKPNPQKQKPKKPVYIEEQTREKQLQRIDAEAAKSVSRQEVEPIVEEVTESVVEEVVIEQQPAERFQNHVAHAVKRRQRQRW